jgi:hypothetical protein
LSPFVVLLFVTKHRLTTMPSKLPLNGPAEAGAGVFPPSLRTSNHSDDLRHLHFNRLRLGSVAPGRLRAQPTELFRMDTDYASPFLAKIGCFLTVVVLTSPWGRLLFGVPPSGGPDRLKPPASAAKLIGIKGGFFVALCNWIPQ